jgi:hypothetical protein
VDAVVLGSSRSTAPAVDKTFNKASETVSLIGDYVAMRDSVIATL